MKVFVVALSQCEWYDIRHICHSKETALKWFEELRQECIENNRQMVDFCVKNNVSSKDYEVNIEALVNMIPGELPVVEYYDYPDLKEWELEE